VSSYRVGRRERAHAGSLGDPRLEVVFLSARLVSWADGQRAYRSRELPGSASSERTVKAQLPAVLLRPYPPPPDDPSLIVEGPRGSLDPPF